MTFFYSHPAATSPKYSWARMAAIASGLLLAVAGGHAAAAVHCATPSATRAASTPCPGRHAHTVTRTRKTLPKADAADDGNLTPVAETVSAKAGAGRPAAERTSRRAGLADFALPASSLRNRLDPAGEVGPSPWRGRGAPAGNHLPQAADAPASVRAVTPAVDLPVSGGSFGDMLRGARASLPPVPAPAAWAILLLGLFGLRQLTRAPDAERAKSWAAAAALSAERPSGRARARGWAVDRVDPERYAPARVARSRQAGFVRASGAGRFGSDGR